MYFVQEYTEPYPTPTFLVVIGLQKEVLTDIKVLLIKKGFIFVSFMLFCCKAHCDLGIVFKDHVKIKSHLLTSYRGMDR